MKHYFLLNRMHWAKHLELLWDNGYYNSVISVTKPLSILMQMEKIGDEIGLWSLTLLKKSVGFVTVEESDAEKVVAWVTLLLEALHVTSKGVLPDQLIIDFSKIAENWLNQNGLEDKLVKPDNKKIFSCLTGFLENYYRVISDWSACHRISLLAKKHYREANAWPLVISSLFTLSRCSFSSGDIEQTDVYENELLNDIPFSDLAPGTKSKVMMNVITSRIGRKDAARAQTLLDDYKLIESHDNSQNIIDNLQAEIFMLNGKLKDATLLFHQILDRMSKFDKKSEIDNMNTIAIKAKLDYLKKELGETSFNEIING